MTMLRLVFAFTLIPRVALSAGPPAAVAKPGDTAAPETRLNEGLALSTKRDWPGAEAAYRAAVRAKPAYPEAWTGLGHALKQQRRWDDALAAYREALRLRPDDPLALEYLGETYVGMGRKTEAEAVLVKLDAIDKSQADTLRKAIAAGGGGY